MTFMRIVYIVFDLITSFVCSGADPDILSGRLTPSAPAVPNCCCSKDSGPYWSNPPF